MTIRHEIGGVCVMMTRAQARRWNGGETTDVDLDAVKVYIPGRVGAYSFVRDGECVVVDGIPTNTEISLRAALDDSDLAEIMEDRSANETT